MRLCPYCEGKFQEELMSCPHCGASVRESEEFGAKSPPASADISSPPKKKANAKIIWAYLALFVVSILGFIVFSSINVSMWVFVISIFIAMPGLTLWLLWKKRERTIHAAIKAVVSFVLVCVMLFAVFALALGPGDDDPPEPPAISAGG